jgi:TolB-like protein/DNA-binding winged helix-turn-helix (wHTH) protein/Tfp pilus assembly protein PilF
MKLYVQTVGGMRFILRVPGKLGRIADNLGVAVPQASSKYLTYQFGPYELRTRTRELYKQGTKLKLRPQPFRVLQLLLERAGDVVTRDELKGSLWPAETFVDFEQGLNTSIKTLRAILSDSASAPQYIETLWKHGYRVMVPVEVSEVTAQHRGEKTVTPSLTIVAADGRGVSGSEFKPPRASIWSWPAAGIAAAVLVVALGGGGYLRWSHSVPRSQAVKGRLMLAVLPFENLTGDSGQDYFSDGLTEEMIAQLGRIEPERLGVIARTSVMHYKHTSEQMDQIGRELGVQYVLEGSVRRDATHVRVTAQLIQTKDQTHLLSRQYDREQSSLLSLQGEIAQEISDEIELTLGERKPGESSIQAASLAPKSYEAYDLYLKGRFFWNKRTAQGMRQAIDYFQQAVAKDPGYARAYSGLADSLALMSAYDVEPPMELVPRARAAALKALSLDEKSAEAHASLALIAQNDDWDWQSSEKEFRRAIELDPSYATGHHWYAEHLAFLGRFDEATQEMQRARELDPLSLIIQTDSAAIAYFARQYDRAIEQFRGVLEMEPNFPRAHMIVSAYVEKGQFAEAFADLEIWRRSTPDGFWTWSTESYTYGRAGRPMEARRALVKLQSLTNEGLLDPFLFAGPYIGLGDRDQALAWLDKAASFHSPGLTALKVDPMFDSLRGDPRFEKLLDRLGFK